MAHLLAIDLCCGDGGWTDGFLANGFHVRGYDVKRYPNYRGELILRDIREITVRDLADADFVIASTPCEEFAVHCMKFWFKNPKPPELGMLLFRRTRNLCETSGIPFVMENVRCAQQFVGQAVNHCGPFYLWGNAVPAVMPRALYSLTKGSMLWSAKYRNMKKSQRKHEVARIPLELADYVAKSALQLVADRREHTE